MRLIALPCALALISANAAAEEHKLFCFVENSAGFSTETIGTWTPGIKPIDRYHLRPATATERADATVLGGRAIYFLSSAAEPTLETPCTRDAPTMTLRCDGVDNFRLSEETGRFVLYYLNGYIDSVQVKKTKNDTKNSTDDGDAPFLDLGLCVKDE